jgi:hypothetical protein
MSILAPDVAQNAYHSERNASYKHGWANGEVVDAEALGRS